MANKAPVDVEHLKWAIKGRGDVRQTLLADFWHDYDAAGYEIRVGLHSCGTVSFLEQLIRI